MFKVNQLHGFNAVSPAPVVRLGYQTTVLDNTNLNTYTFTAVALGPANTNRTIHCVAGWTSATKSVSAATIGGIAATIIHQSSVGTDGVCAFMAAVPAGATGDIVVTLTGTGTTANLIVHVYRSTLVAPVPVQHKAATATATTVQILDLRTVIGGFNIVATLNNHATDDIATTYTGVDSPVEDNESANDGPQRFNSASIVATESVLTNDWTATTTNSVFKRMIGQCWAASSSLPQSGLDYYLAVDGSGTSPATFSAMPFGPDISGRMVIAVITWGAGSDRSLSSATIGGVAATIVQQAHNAPTNGGGSAIITATGVTGTFGDVVATFSGTVSTTQCSTFFSKPASSTAVDSGTSNTVGTSKTVTDIEVKNGGFIVCVSRNGGTGAQSTVYNGTDTAVLNEDYTNSGAVYRVSTWSALTTENATTNDPGFSTAASVIKNICAASWL